uniref:polymorphic toxin type 30 domain-containing protein n=1 Tax=Fictibacillus gelatini TaxID=225985 RepID=UPI00047C1EE6
SIRQAKRYSNHTIEQLHAFDKAQTAALETVEHDLALMANYIKQIGTAIKSGEVNLSNYSVKQITSCESYNDLIGDLAQKTNPYENKYRRPDADEQLIAASYIGELQNKNLTKEEFETLKGKVETVHILDELDEYDGDYHIYANGMIVREYKDEHFNIRYEFVDKIRKKRTGRAEGQDSLFEGTPLELIEYAVPGGLIKTGATKLGKKAITGIEKKLVKEFSGDAGNTAANDIISNIPSNAIKRDLTPTDNIKEGVEYKWNDGGATWRVRIHSKDLSAPNGSNASKGWIMRVQRGKWFMDSQGNWHKRNLLSPNSPFFDEKIADQTHIPIKKLR